MSCRANGRGRGSTGRGSTAYLDVVSTGSSRRLVFLRRGARRRSGTVSAAVRLSRRRGRAWTFFRGRSGGRRYSSAATRTGGSEGFLSCSISRWRGGRRSRRGRRAFSRCRRGGKAYGYAVRIAVTGRRGRSCSARYSDGCYWASGILIGSVFGSASWRACGSNGVRLRGGPLNFIRRSTSYRPSRYTWSLGHRASRSGERCCGVTRRTGLWGKGATIQRRRSSADASRPVVSERCRGTGARSSRRACSWLKRRPRS